MKRTLRLVSFLLLLTACAALSGCSGKPTAAQLPACDAVATAVQGAQTFEELTAISKEKMADRLAIDPTKLTDQAMLMDVSRTTAECIVVLKATDDAALQALDQALHAYRDAALAQYRDYQPDEVPKLEGAVLRSNGLQTVLVVSPSAAKAQQALDEVWK